MVQREQLDIRQHAAPEDNMTCMRIAVERGSTMLIVRGVPAQVCDNCDEPYLSADAVDRLQQMLTVAAQGGVQVEVRKFIAA